MYLFYQQKGGEESWKKVEDTKDNRLALRDKGAAFIAALSISKTEDIDFEKVKYKGDLYFDIDSSDISESIEIVNKLVKRLQDLEVKNINVYCSGKKGFHVTVPSKVFSKGSQVTYLPYVYGKMAEKLDVAGLDFAVYSGGAGRLWRQENVFRPDVKTFKTQIPVDRVPALNTEKYQVYVSSPSPEIANKEIVKSLPLSDLYETCKVIVQEEEKTKERYEFEPIPELEDLKEVPKCIINLVTKGDQKSGANFNQAAMQFAGFVKAANLETETVKQLIGTMADNVSSGTYNTQQKRVKHINSQVRRAKHDPRMGFSASYLFSTVEPCGSCILCDGTLDKYTEKGADKEDSKIPDNPIFISGGRYWVRMGKVDRPISTFVLKPLAYSESYDPSTHIPERESTTVSVEYDHLGEHKKYVRSIPERSWDSSSAFKKALSGIDNVSFMGSEQDLAHLKHYVFSRECEMGRITKTKSCGIASYKNYATGKSLLVYSEPENSINMFGEIGTHDLSAGVFNPPRVLDKKELDPENPEHVKLAKEITKINSPVNVALILGWFAATHFKPHFMATNKQFPLLGLWGNAGSGKTKTASLMSYLHGCDFEGVDSVVSCGNSTPWSIKSYIASSTSTPRILDEFNRSKIKLPIYNNLVEVLKGCFNEQTSTKGTIAGRSDGAEIDEVKFTGPVVVMSEQFPEDEPPLIQRMVTVKLSRKSHEGCEKSWAYSYDNKALLPSIGKSLVMASLKTPKSTIEHWMNHYYDEIPPERVMDARPHYSFRVVLTGLKMYELTMKSNGIDVSEEVHRLTSSLIDYLFKCKETISQRKSRSVVDGVLDVMAQMATDAAKNEFSRNVMVSGKAYIKTAEYLWIDAESIYSQYKIFARQLGETILLNHYRSFRELLEEEEYFVKDDMVEPLSKSRSCIQLDVEKLMAKGVSVNLFEIAEGED